MTNQNDTNTNQNINNSNQNSKNKKIAIGIGIGALIAAGTAYAVCNGYIGPKATFYASNGSMAEALNEDDM